MLRTSIAVPEPLFWSRCDRETVVWMLKVGLMFDCHLSCRPNLEPLKYGSYACDGAPAQGCGVMRRAASRLEEGYQ